MATTESSLQPSTEAIKIGPCGGFGGSAQDITEEPMRLQSIAIRSGAAIDSIEFSYLDVAGKPRSAGPWGGSGGRYQHLIQLADDEFVIEVSGTFGTFEDKTVVSALKIVTNLKTYGPYGKWGWGVAPFSLPVQPGSAIVGMFARSGEFINAIGVYVRHI